MAEDAPDETARAGQPVVAAPDGPAAPSERAGEFEKYALIAALTLVVLCLLVWDNWQGGARPVTTPRPDRTLRVELGGDAPRPGAAPRGGDPKRVTEDVPPAPAPPPAPPAPARRSYTVKSGDTLGEIASRELGSAARAQEIADLNGIADPAKIRQGQEILLPAK